MKDKQCGALFEEKEIIDEHGYGLKNVSDNAKYKSFKKVYNEMYNLYNLKEPKKGHHRIDVINVSNIPVYLR